MTDLLQHHRHDSTMKDTTMNDTTRNDTTLNDTTRADAVRRAKVEELQRRRAASAGTVGPAASSAPGRGSARKGVAQGSKIAATAIGMTAMLGIVGAMSAAAQKNTSPTPAATPTPAQVIVVIHPAPATGTAGTGTATAAGTAAATSGQPIVLSAKPTVRQAAAVSAPAAKTNGSR